MTRQVIMVFFGKARWEDQAEEHGAHGDFKPHESPWIMLAPLVVLAGWPTVGGIIQLPSHWLPESITQQLEHWLEPVIEFGEADIGGTWGYGNKTILMLFAIAAAVGGISSPGWSTRRTGSRPSSRRSWPTPGTTTRRSATSWAGPAGRLRGRGLVRRPRRRRRRQRRGTVGARHRR